MTKLQVTLELQGDAFSPSAAERLTGLALVRKVEPDQIGERGRYRNKPTPYGAAALEAPDALPERDKLNWLLDTAMVAVGALRELGAISIGVSATYAHDGQCNLEYSPAELEKLSALGLPFSVSCYRDESQFTPESSVAG